MKKAEKRADQVRAYLAKTGGGPTKEEMINRIKQLKEENKVLRRGVC